MLHVEQADSFTDKNIRLHSRVHVPRLNCYKINGYYFTTCNQLFIKGKHLSNVLQFYKCRNIFQ